MSLSEVIPEPPHRTFVNLKRPDRDSYTREAEESFALLLGLPSSCSTGELLFRKILNTFAKHHFPQGHIPNRIPNRTESATRLLIERDALRSSSPPLPLLTHRYQNSSHKSTTSKEYFSHKCNISRLGA